MAYIFAANGTFFVIWLDFEEKSAANGANGRQEDAAMTRAELAEALDTLYSKGWTPKSFVEAYSAATDATLSTAQLKRMTNEDKGGRDPSAAVTAVVKWKLSELNEADGEALGDAMIRALEAHGLRIERDV